MGEKSKKDRNLNRLLVTPEDYTTTTTTFHQQIIPRPTIIMELASVKKRFGIIGNTEVINRALEVALRVAPTDLSVLITGESGVGKEFFPQVIHSYSPRKHSNYIAVNCGAIPEGTIDSELFGHEKGSFTGANEARKGYFEVANGGTIFLDEVAELPLTTQVRLLRVLQTGEYIRVGSSKSQKTNVRVVAATNINLTTAIESGRFREDLYYRLNTVPIAIPPLRERPEDIHLLFRKFASDIATQYNMPPICLTPDARVILEKYYWSGNVRQLKNVAEQISAIEILREINATTLQKYLPLKSPNTLPMIVNKPSQNFSDTTERDILYKLMFDLRGEVSELKAMMRSISNQSTGTQATPQRGEYVATTPQLRGEFATSIPHLRSEVYNPPHQFIDSAPAHLRGDSYTPKHQYIETQIVSEIEEPPPPQPTTKEEAQQQQILAALAKHDGNRREAAAELFISERTLYRRIKELGIDE